MANIAYYGGGELCVRIINTPPSQVTKPDVGTTPAAGNGTIAQHYTAISPYPPKNIPNPVPWSPPGSFSWHYWHGAGVWLVHHHHPSGIFYVYPFLLFFFFQKTKMGGKVKQALHQHEKKSRCVSLSSNEATHNIYTQLTETQRFRVPTPRRPFRPGPFGPGPVAHRIFILFLSTSRST